MLVAAITAPQTIELQSRPIPSPGSGQVRIRLQGCGVCASNLPVWEGRPWFNYPLEPGAPGHEGWGIIDAVGQDVRGVAEGERVAVLSYHAFAEYDIADAAAIVKLPATLDGAAAPGEPLGCAANILQRADIHAGQRVAVVGIGFLGAILVQMAKRSGATVFAVSRRPWSLTVARCCGADFVYALTDPEAICEELSQVAGGSGCERVIEATGKQIGMDVATQLVAERGKLVIAGYHQDGMRQVNMQLWNWRGIDVINAHERDQQVYVRGIEAAFDFVERGELDYQPLLTHQFEMGELRSAFQVAAERPDGFLKSYVTCGF
jgi:threonine dehydrogenase-like Zn-dependent dehydrogenase